MQAFDQASEQKAFLMPKLTAQSLEYGRDQMPFLAFGGTEKPRNYVSEYMTAEKWNVNNTYGNLGKGGYDDVNPRVNPGPSNFDEIKARYNNM